MKILKRTTITVACISALYMIGIYALHATEYSYRMWVNVLGIILTGCVLPLLTVLLAGKCLYQIYHVKSIVKIILGLIGSIVYAFWVLCVVLFLMFAVDQERKLTDHLLVVQHAEFLDESHYAYYRPVAFLFRTPGELTDESKAEYLEEKYGRDFEVAVEGTSFWKGASDKERIYDKEHPEIKVGVYRSGMELVDNYPEKLSQKYLEEGMETLGITREYYVAEDSMGYSGWMYLELMGEADIEGLGTDASLLIQYVMDRTDLFETCRGVLGFYDQENGEKVIGILPFGKISRWDDVQKDYYWDQELVIDRVRTEYEEEQAYLERIRASRTENLYFAEPNAGEQAADGTGETGEQAADDAGEQAVGGIGETGTQSANDAPEQEMSSEENDAIADYRQEAAQKVYDAVLAEKGYSYEVKYNAKGNLYIELGTRAAGEPEDKSSTGFYHFTLVYDRTSKNGACELLVLYQEHYTENNDGSKNVDGTAILDMYAVDKTTGEVISSGKQGWADVGSEAYRQATGE